MWDKPDRILCWCGPRARPQNGVVSAEDLAARFSRRLEERGASCSSREVEQLATYVGLLTKWNNRVNLTALQLNPISDDAIDRLIVEPVMGASLLRAGTEVVKGHLVDVGSGGGSPAIPLKVALPDLRLTMVESKERKSAFLREAVRSLGLLETTVLTQRVEDLAADPIGRGSVQVVSVRAVRLDEALWSALDALLAVDGVVLWFRAAADAVKAADQFKVESVLATRDSRDEIALLRRR